MLETEKHYHRESQNNKKQSINLTYQSRPNLFRKEQPREEDFLTKELKERKSRDRYCEIDRKEVKRRRRKIYGEREG